MKSYIIIILFACTQAFAQSYPERELTTNIKEVTVFLQGAQITRSGTASIPKGKSLLRVKELSPFIDSKSVQVKATGNFTIVAVNPTLNHLNEMRKDHRIDSLSQISERLASTIKHKEARLEVLDEKMSILNINRKLGGENAGASVSQIREAIRFYEEQLTAIKSEQILINDEVRSLEKRMQNIQTEINKVSQNKELPTGEVEIQVEADEYTTASFKMTYIVANAGWYPKYDLRVESVDKPLQLTYKAEVYQQTGINWNNVNLKLSNGNPNESGVAPVLRTWFLNYARNTIFNRNTYNHISANPRTVSGTIYDETGEPLIGANVIIKGSTIGTVTDISGNYSLTLPNNASHLMISFVGYESQVLPISGSKMNAQLEMDVQELSEVVVVGYGAESSDAPNIRVRGTGSYYKEPKAKTITTTVVENQTTVEFEVDEPYSVKSTGEKITVELNQHSIETTYQYFAVPKLDKDAFLIARITNWDQFNLLEGEANLYFEDAYVGRSILNAGSLDDTLNISLGRDKSIVIGRTKVNDYTRKRTIGSNKIETRGFEILARNKKSQAIKLTLFDQIPVAAISDISVSLTEKSQAVYNESNGEIKWEFDLAPQDHVELKLGYEVKYPKHEQVILE